MTPPRTLETIGTRRWLILAVGIIAQTTTTTFLYGLAFLIPQLQAEQGLSLAEAGFLVTTPIFGLLACLIAWGVVADRRGERIVMAAGTGAAGLVLLGSIALPGLVALGAAWALAGACAAAVNAASGRVVIGWFDTSQRGMAMGIRQTAQPLGVGLASATLPAIGQHWGFRAALAFPAILCLVSAALVAVVIIDPPRPQRTRARVRSPYRFPHLWRLHVASALLVVPQFVVSTFALTYLVSRQEWDAVMAGQLVAAVQLAGAAARIGAGVWSDRVRSRTRPMRLIALLATASMALWVLGDMLVSWLALAALLLALVVTVAPNGLALTSVAETAGPSWAGRAISIHNTSQNVIALVVAPLFGGIIGGTSYAVAITVAGILPALAVLIIPVRMETLEPLA